MEELLGKRIPYSSQAEQSVIGSMLIDTRCIPDVLSKLKAEDFYNVINKNIYETISSMLSFGKTIDAVTVLDEMKIRGVHNDDSERYLIEVMRQTPTAANVLEYAEIIRDKALLRRLGESADDINKMVYEGSGEADEVLESAERRIYALRQGRNVGGLLSIKDVIGNVFDSINEAAQSGNKIPGLSTGLDDLDKMILGLNKSDFILVAARPGMGKTSIALNIALHVGMKLKKKVAFFSLEMSREQLVTRLLAEAAMVPSQNLLTGQLSDTQWELITEAASRLNSADIKIDDNPTLTVADMNAACRRVDNLGLIVIDYLQLMSSGGGGKSYSNENRTQVVSDISRMMKVMAKELNVPVICLSQLNRAAEGRNDKRPMLSDLRESGAIEQDADVVIGLYRDGYYNKEVENPNLAEAIVLKNRKGQTGTAQLLWIPEFTTFTSYAGDRYDE